MIISKITPLVEKTSILTEIPLEDTAKIIKFQFEELKKHLLTTPSEKTVQLEHLGKFRGRLKMVNTQIMRILPKVRENPELKSTLSYLWSLRQALMKERDHRNYKQRFGKWHYK